MATEIGTGTSYPVTLPSGTDAADIQAALKYLVYGVSSTPLSNSDITSNSVFGKMSLLAPKSAPAFTGNGSISGNFSIGGNLTVSGSINTLLGSSSVFEDKQIILNGNTASTDAAANEGGLVVWGATAKYFAFQNGTGWSSTENLNLSSGKTFKINGTDVLSSSAVLGIAADNIATKSGNNTFSGSTTFSGSVTYNGGTQNINGLTIDSSGKISKALVNNEWAGPIVVSAPGSPVQYSVSGTSHVAYEYSTFVPVYFDPDAGQYYGFSLWREIISMSMNPGSLVAGDTVYANSLSSYSGAAFTILQVNAGTSIIAKTTSTIYQVYSYQSNQQEPVSSYAGPGGTILDYYEGGGLQSWMVGNSSIADIDRNGNFTNSGYAAVGSYVTASSFKDTGYQYHTNPSIPRFSVGLASGSATIFSANTGLTTPWQNATAGNSVTPTTTGKWFATGFSSSTNTSGNMTYALDNGIGLVTVSRSGLYAINASLTPNVSAAGNLIGIFIVESNGTKNEPFLTSNMATAGNTANISALISLTAGQKIGLAVYAPTASTAVSLKNDATFYKTVSFSGYLVG